MPCAPGEVNSRAISFIDRNWKNGLVFLVEWGS